MYRAKNKKEAGADGGRPAGRPCFSRADSCTRSGIDLSRTSHVKNCTAHFQCAIRKSTLRGSGCPLPLRGEARAQPGLRRHFSRAISYYTRRDVLVTSQIVWQIEAATEKTDYADQAVPSHPGGRRTDRDRR